MNLSDLLVSDVDEVFLNSDEFAETITYREPAGQTITITAVVDRQASRIEQRTNHRLLVEPVTVRGASSEIAWLGGQSSVIVDDKEYDFVSSEDDEGMVTATFEHVSILDTGLETGDV